MGTMWAIIAALIILFRGERMGRKQKRWESAYLNNVTYLDFYNRLKELCLNVFEWENLPPTVDERFLELCLFEKGYCLYFNEKGIGDLALTCTIGGQLNVYNIPTERRPYSNIGYSFDPRTSKNSVLIFNNFMHTPTEMTIRLFARRLYEIERAIDTNVKGQKFPIALLAPEQQRLTIKNVYMQYDGNEPFILGDKNLDLEAIKAIKTDSPYVADKLTILKHNVWNEALTFIGIENSNQDKRERLVADEVSSNYGNVEAQRNVMLNSRRQAATKINRMFGTNISVRYRSNLETMVNIDNMKSATLEQIENFNNVSRETIDETGVKQDG